MTPRRHKDVEDMIFRGFIATKVQLGEVNLVLKSLNTRELESIRDRTPLKSDKNYNEVFEALILAYGLYLLDGENVLVGRPQNISELVAEMRDVPSNLRNDLMSEILILQKAQDFALLKLEGFCYEQSSRSSWDSYKGRAPNDPMLTGIVGTDRLGLNSHQIAWTFLNTEEDKRVDSETQWSYAKFVASATNPKGVKKVESSDAARLKKLREDRERVRLGIEYQGEERIERRTVQDLRSQLESDVTGKQDLHDKIVSQYEHSIRTRREERAAEREALIILAREKAQTDRDELSDEELAQSLTDGTGFVKVYNAEQIEQMRERQGLEALERSQNIHKSRVRHAQQYKKDREEIAVELQSLANSESSGPPASLEIPTGPNGPMKVSTQPVRNRQIPGVPTHPPTHPPTRFEAERSGDMPPSAPRPEGTTVGHKTLPSGEVVQVFENHQKGSGGNSGDLSGGGASKRLTRHTYGPDQQRDQGRRTQAKQVNVKKTGTVYTEVPGEEDFFAGSDTSFTNSKAGK